MEEEVFRDEELPEEVALRVGETEEETLPFKDPSVSTFPVTPGPGPVLRGPHPSPCLWEWNMNSIYRRAASPRSPTSTPRTARSASS